MESLGGPQLCMFRAVAAAYLTLAVIGSAQTISTGELGGGSGRLYVKPKSVGLGFSDSPTNSEFLRMGLFAQPLIPVGATNREENRRLAAALITYAAAARQEGRDAVQPIL